MAPMLRFRFTSRSAPRPPRFVFRAMTIGGLVFLVAMLAGMMIAPAFRERITLIAAAIR